MASSVKIDSNITGLRACEELTLGVLDPTPANQRWVEQEPNSYESFGGEITTVARNPINPGRQRKKGTPTNVEASPGFNADLTQTNFQDMLRGFMYANYRSKQEFTGAAQTVATSDDSYGATNIHTGFFAGDLVLASGYAVTANNGLKNVSAATGNKVTVTQNLVNETSPATAKLVCVGFQFSAGDATIVTSSGFPVLQSTTKDLTQLGLIPGEPVFVGGDSSTTRFALNAPFIARVRSVTTNAITFDKTSATLVADDGTSTGSGGTNNVTLQLFKARILKNEIGTAIIRRSYALELTLGVSDPSQPTREQAQYVLGSVPNEFTMNLATADKVTCDLGFIGTNPFTIDEVVSGANTLLSKISGVVRVPVVEADAFNTSSDITRIRLSTVSATNSAPTPLFTYSEEATITVNNNNSPNTALGVFGAFEVTAGTFEVGGSLTAYFGDVAAIQAIRNNADVTLDVFFAKSNSGIAIDIPLLNLGGGLPNIEQDQPVTIPLELSAVTGAKIASTLNHTLLLAFFDYLPNAAEV